MISVADLQRFDKKRGEVLVLSGRFKPYLTRLADISAYDNNRWKSEPDYIHESVIAEMPNVDMRDLAKWMIGENTGASAEDSVPLYLFGNSDRPGNLFLQVSGIENRSTESDLNRIIASSH